MLKKSNISDIKMYLQDGTWRYRPKWREARLGKLTSSRISAICGERGIGEGGETYIQSRVAEELTGTSADPEIDTPGTQWGGRYESEALDKFGSVQKLSFLVTQQLITAPGSRFGSTPDGLIVCRESIDQLEYEVEPIEVKAPQTLAAYMGLALCETPQDVKRENKSYYWQLISQIVECESLRGWLCIYHPLFRVGNLNIIEFRSNAPLVVKGQKTYPINDDMKILRERKELAVKRYNEIRDKMLLKGRF